MPSRYFFILLPTIIFSIAANTDENKNCEKNAFGLSKEQETSTDHFINNDHLRLRLILSPIFEDGLSYDDHWTVYQPLYNDIVTFAKQFPSSEERSKFLQLTADKVDNATLSSDHERLRSILYPELACVLDYATTEAERSNSFQLSLFYSADYFSVICPTHDSRVSYIEKTKKKLDKKRIDDEREMSILLDAWLRFNAGE